jgi:hypothetical protein
MGDKRINVTGIKNVIPKFNITNENPQGIQLNKLDLVIAVAGQDPALTENPGYLLAPRVEGNLTTQAKDDNSNSIWCPADAVRC